MKEDTGQILIVDKIVNNNIVIAKDFRGREVVAIGKGVGFRKRKNEAVHRSEIMKTYVLLDKVDSGVLTLFEEIQFEVIETSQKIIDYAQEKLNVKFNVNLLMSLSDHIFDRHHDEYASDYDNQVQKLHWQYLLVQRTRDINNFFLQNTVRIQCFHVRLEKDNFL